MGFPKGHKKVGGRKRGSTNVKTAAVKDALVEAFDKMGGVKSLVAWGEKNPGQFYAIWSKLLPVELKNPDGETFRVEMVEEIVDAHDPPHDPAP
jgi:hypothetical protein